MIQTIVVILIVALAAAYLLRPLLSRKSARKGGCGCGSEGCDEVERSH